MPKTAQNKDTLTPEMKHMLLQESCLSPDNPMQKHLERVVQNRQYELHCYFEAVLARVRPRHCDEKFTKHIQKEADEHMLALRNLLKRSNAMY
jgi:uncharacterized protein Yka (UPF0111/DUF47 family)